MKKFLKFSILLIATLTLVGCSSNKNIDKTNEIIDVGNDSTDDVALECYFEAIVLEIDGNRLTVRPVDNSNELRSSDKIVFSYDLSNLGIEEGQTIGIVYDGEIAESYPAQIFNVSHVGIVEEIKVENVEDWGIELSVDSVTTSGLTLICNQTNSNSKFSTESFFKLEVFEDDEWKDVSYIISEEEVAWDMMSYMIYPDEPTIWDINWEWIYGELSSGKYRIGKNIYKFDEVENHLNQTVSEVADIQIIYTEFTIE